MIIKFRLIMFFLFLYALPLANVISANEGFTISRIHYGGGGDWYSDKTSLPNLLKFVSENTGIIVNPEEVDVKIGEENFYSNSYFYITGHGNIKLSDEEVIILREHLINGAFLHADDNYGMDASFRALVIEMFPNQELVEIPPSHDLFNIHYKFENGLPKIHEHDNKRPQALGIFYNQRLVLLYTYESDLGDGWESQNVHKNPEELRQEALKMGTNIIVYSLLQ